MAATLINGDHILALKAKLQLFNSATIGAGATDPTSVALLGAAGDVYISTSTKRVYQKQDAGTTTSWSPLDASFSVGIFGSTPNTAGASITGDVLTLQPADATHPGGVSTGTQTFAGEKDFSGVVRSGTTSNVVSTATTVTGEQVSILNTFTLSPDATVYGLAVKANPTGNTAQAQASRAIFALHEREITSNTTDSGSMTGVNAGIFFNAPNAITLTNNSLNGMSAITVARLTQVTPGSVLATSYQAINVNADTTVPVTGRKTALRFQGWSGGTLGNALIADNITYSGDYFINSTNTNPTLLSGALTASNFSGTSSGTNTGDQTITLTGGVTGSGTGSFAATVVTNANLTGPITSVGNATSIASQTGTGNTFVMSAGPTFSGSTSFPSSASISSSGIFTGGAFTSTSSNAASTGIVRMSSGDAGIVFRNNANSGDVAITKNTSDALLWNGHVFISSAGALSATNLSGTNTGDQTITLTGGVTGSGTGSFAATVVTNANLTGPITSSGNATSIASQTGTGTTFVMNTSPVLVTPNLGTPTTLVGTNITGTAASLTAGTVTTNANLTGDITSSGNATTAAATQGNITSLSNASGVAVHGTNTNNSASAGFVGEYVSNTVSNTSVGTSATWFDGTSISLTAGDWEVTAVAYVANNGSTNTINSLGISTTTGNSTTGLTLGDNRTDMFPSTAVYDSGGNIPTYRMSLSGTTTVYLKLLSAYSVATPKYYCRLSARRMR